MDAATFLAQLIGVLYTVMGLSIFLDSPRFRQMLTDIQKANAVFLYIAGVTALSIGFTIITFHNVWTADWQGALTLIGWIALAKGVLLLLQPKLLIQKVAFWQDRLLFTAGLLLCVGLFFGYHGFAG